MCRARRRRRHGLQNCTRSTLYDRAGEHWARARATWDARAKIDQRVSEVARILDLSGLMENRRPKQLRRSAATVAMGRAIVGIHSVCSTNRCPISTPNFGCRCARNSGGSHSRLGVTKPIHVTHDQIEAMTLGHRVAVFSRGTLSNTPRRIRSSTKPLNVFVAGFVGSPAMDFLQGALNDGGSTISVGKGKIPASGRAARRILALTIGACWNST